MFHFRLVAVALMGVWVSAMLVVSPTSAESAGEGTLTTDQVTRWASSMTAMRPWTEANEDRFEGSSFKVKPPRMNPMSPPSEEDMQKMRSPFSYAVLAAREVGIDAEIAALVAPHGFSLEEWGSTGDRIVRAFIALQMQNGPDMQASLNTTIAEMEQNDRMSAEQKDMLISSLTQTLDMYNMMRDAPLSDMDAVRPLTDLLQQTLAP